MIRRGSYIGETQGDVRGRSVRDQLYRDQSLIMVRRQHHVKLTRVRTLIQTIRWVGAEHRDSFLAAFDDGWRQYFIIFRTEHATLTGMRIDGRYGYAGTRVIELLEFGVDQMYQVQIEGHRKRRDSVPYGKVRRCQYDLEGRSKEGHGCLRDRGAITKEICLSAEFVSNKLFTEWGGDE